jgi:hypothetical protein
MSGHGATHLLFQLLRKPRQGEHEFEVRGRPLSQKKREKQQQNNNNKQKINIIYHIKNQMNNFIIILTHNYLS